MPFSQRTTDFLAENCLNDSRTWYNEHKSEYQEYVMKPMTELMTALKPTVEAIDRRIECDTRRISRLFKDARYLRGGPIFRENVWCSFPLSRERYDNPAELYFEISPNGVSYGFGWYQTPLAVMNVMRAMIIEGSPSFAAAKKGYESQNLFVMDGDTYKRDRYPDKPEDIRKWLNLRSIYFHYDSADPELMCSESLAERVAHDYMLLAPIVRFLADCQEREFVERMMKN